MKEAKLSLHPFHFLNLKRFSLKWRSECFAPLLFSVTFSRTAPMTYSSQEDRIKLFQRFGDLKVIRLDTERPGWILCECKCGKTRSVMESRLIAGEIIACVACTARQKMEKPI